MAYQIQIGVEIKTDNGTFWRFSEEVTVSGSIITFENNMLVYPDRRATRFHLYCRDADGTDPNVPDTWVEFGAWQAQASPSLNMAYVDLGGNIDLQTVAPRAARPSNWQSLQQQIEIDDNKVLISEAPRPFEFRAGGALWIGNASENRIIRLASSALPVSTGQFGAYPVLAFCPNSIFAIAISEAGLPASIVPLTMELGLASPHALVSVENTVFFAHRSGVYAIGPNLEIKSLSDTIYNPSSELSLRVDSTAELVYLRQGVRQELWYASGVQPYSYIFSVPAVAWSSADRGVRGVVPYLDDPENALLLLLDDGSLWVEGSDFATSESWEITFYPLYLEEGEQALWKRLWRLSVRGVGEASGVSWEVFADNVRMASGTLDFSVSDTFVMVSGHGKAFTLKLSGQNISADFGLIELLAEYETRYEHRARRLP